MCHPGKHAAAVVEKEAGLTGVFIRDPGFCDSEKNMFFLASVKARAPDKHAGKTSVLFNDSCGVFSGVTHLLSVNDTPVANYIYTGQIC